MDQEKILVKFDSFAGESALVFCCFATSLLTIGDPDIIDAIIFYLMK